MFILLFVQLNFKYNFLIIKFNDWYSTIFVDSLKSLQRKHLAFVCYSREHVCYARREELVYSTDCFVRGQKDFLGGKCWIVLDNAFNKKTSDPWSEMTFRF